MGDTLRNRFLLSVSPLTVFFKLIGIHINVFGSKWRRYLINLWSLAWLALSIYCNFRLFTTRGLDSLCVLLYGKEGSSWIFSMNSFVSHFTSIFFGVSTQILLMFNIRKTANLFWTQLEPDDLQLGRPNLGSLKLYSTCSIVWILSVVVLQCGFVVGWEFFRPFPLNWSDLFVKEFVTISNMFSALSTVTTFLVFGQLLVIFYKATATELSDLNFRARKKGNSNPFKEVVRTVKQLQRLNLAARLVNERFDLLLKSIYCWSVVYMVCVTYFFVQSAYQRQIEWVAWDVYQLLEYFLRLIGIFYTVDRIRKASIQCVPILRRLRDDSTLKMSGSEKMEVTLLIIEISQQSSSIEALQPSRTLALSKKLILKVIQIVLNYLIILYEFKADWNVGKS